MFKSRQPEPHPLSPENAGESGSDQEGVKASRAAPMNSAGLPVGVQVVARPWREDIVLALMEALEEQTGVSLPIWAGS